jgi:two-component system, chemotaxis family, protein-glutamate methylesterase/glutaminase
VGSATNLREILASTSAFPIVIDPESKRLEVGKVYIREPAQHLTLTANTFGKLTDDPARSYRETHGGPPIQLGSYSRRETDDWRGAVGVTRRRLAWLSRYSQARRPFYRFYPLGCRLNWGMPEHAIKYDGPISLVGSPVLARGPRIRMMITLQRAALRI